MKQIKKLFFVITAIISLVISVCSALASVSVTPSNIDFGNINWGETSETEHFTITNNDSLSPISVSITSTANSNYYTVDFGSSPFNLNANESKEIYVDVTLRKDEPRNEGGNKSIGDIVINAGGATEHVHMSLTALPRLQISNLDVKVGTSSDSDVQNGDTIAKKAKPGDEVEFLVELENLFHKDDTKYDIEDTNIQITLKEIDDGDDLDEESDDFIIDAGSKKETSLKFIIPEIVKSGNYNVLIEVQGRNSENTSNKYTIEWNLKLSIEKKKHDVVLNKYELVPNSLLCGASKTVLNIGLFNMGETNEDSVAIEVKNSGLNINERFTGISLGSDYDSDARYQKDIPLEIEPEFLVAGNYPLIVSVYFDDDILDDQKTVNLEIKSCNQQEEPVVQEQQPVIQEQNLSLVEAVTEENTENLILENSEEQTFGQMPPAVRISSLSDFKASSFYMPVIGLLILFGIIVLTISVVVFLRKD